MKAKIAASLSALIMVMIFTACAGNNANPYQTQESQVQESQAQDNQAQESQAQDNQAQGSQSQDNQPIQAPATDNGRPRPNIDRQGYAITLPEEIQSIVSIGSSNTEVLVELGVADRIIATDMFSADVLGLPYGISSSLSIVGLDAEYVVSLMPDVVFMTSIARAGGQYDPMTPIIAAGITVINMPTSTGIAEIMEDIRFVSAVMDVHERGEEIVLNMQDQIDQVREIAANIQTPRTVYFEISPPPHMVSFGSGTFLNEIIELTGAINILSHEQGWISITDEMLLEANPDVILTSTDWLDDAIEEIMQRPGFNAITAVQNNDVFEITTSYSSRPSHNVVKALWEIAQAVFPEYF